MSKRPPERQANALILTRRAEAFFQSLLVSNEYNVTIHSRPGGDPDLTKDVADGPWVATLADFATEEEDGREHPSYGVVPVHAVDGPRVRRQVRRAVEDRVSRVGRPRTPGALVLRVSSVHRVSRVADRKKLRAFPRRIMNHFKYCAIS